MSVPPDRRDAQDELDTRRTYARYAGLGLQFAATLGLFTWLGWWVDGRFETSPVFLLLGVLLGFAGSLISIVSKVPPARGRRESSPRSTTRPPEQAEGDSRPPSARA